MLYLTMRVETKIGVVSPDNGHFVHPTFRRLEEFLGNAQSKEIPHPEWAVRVERLMNGISVVVHHPAGNDIYRFREGGLCWVKAEGVAPSVVGAVVPFKGQTAELSPADQQIVSDFVERLLDETGTPPSTTPLSELQRLVESL